MSEQTKFDPEKVNELPPYVSSESNQIIRAISRIDYEALLALHKASLERERVQAKLEIVVADELKTIHAKLDAESQLRELREIVKEYRERHEDYPDSDFSLSCTLLPEGKDNRCPTCIKADLFLRES